MAERLTQVVAEDSAILAEELGPLLERLSAAPETAGATSVSAVAEATGMSEAAVKNALNRLRNVETPPLLNPTQANLKSTASVRAIIVALIAFALAIAMMSLITLSSAPPNLAPPVRVDAPPPTEVAVPDNAVTPSPGPAPANGH